MTITVNGVIAANRFGLGALPTELNSASNNPKQWLKQQLVPILFNDNFPSSGALAEQLNQYRVDKAKAEKNANMKMAKPQFPRVALQMAAAAMTSAIESRQSLSWRLLDFFSNHFSVTAAGQVMVALAPTLEREAIAPYLTGSFEQMLLAVSQHPAMLIYLNNEQSFGPNSKMGKRGKGLNENLAREILELHTLGVNSGYTQTDVVELAKGLSGWSVARPKKDKRTGFIFRDRGHEPGTRTLLNSSYPESGVKQGQAMLKFLANHPKTAQHLCTKLARHFIADQPPTSLVEKLTQTWQRTQGNIKAVIETLIDANESWQTQRQKFKTPREFVISTMRAVGMQKTTERQLIQSLKTLGQQPFKAGSPAGYSDVASSWAGASAMMARIDWSAAVAAQQNFNAERILAQTLGLSVSDNTYRSVLRAESREQALTLLLMSPEFIRR
ncbi:DUF1800 domain-containing protein [Echinimonas agarilytica]|uniref:DUF1800 domain-containing protein n=1 Tax=Echinimonas agarilytica TaxID=1215918 RepID=A0AA42B8L7_9GAMM|nr:DUF1800 domain-containing protein [Echinimonas agarilytica]MCM2680351.1 DUF1800 domain-containing protein [Echinimonas agarilytica]